jgi:hypothetical protein
MLQPLVVTMPWTVAASEDAGSGSGSDTADTTTATLEVATEAPPVMTVDAMNPGTLVGTLYLGLTSGSGGSSNTRSIPFGLVIDAASTKLDACPTAPAPATMVCNGIANAAMR